MPQTTHPDFCAQSNWLAAIIGELDLPDADRVADHLKALGITGEMDNPLHCPIANFVKERWPAHWPNKHGALAITVEYGGHVDIGELTDGLYTHWARASLPGAAASFVRRFDDGAYLDLDA